MRRLFKAFFAILIAGGAFLFISSVLFPLIYRIKEPCFKPPVSSELVVRNDAYGEGAFGAKRKNGRTHSGLDLAAKLKSPVYASKSGWARAYCVPSGYGNLVIIKHPGGAETRYGHLHRSTVINPGWVRQGAVIGYIGKTGNAGERGIMPHLHFEIRHKGVPVDPAGELVKKR